MDDILLYGLFSALIYGLFLSTPFIVIIWYLNDSIKKEKNNKK